MLRAAALKKHQLIAHTVRDGEKKINTKIHKHITLFSLLVGNKMWSADLFSLEMHSQCAVYMEMNRWLAPQRYGKYGQSDD